MSRGVGAVFAKEIADLDVPGAERFGGGQQQVALLIGAFAPFVVEEPVVQELELDVLDAVVVDDAAHVGEGATLEDVGEVGVPDPETLESGLGRSLRPGP